MGGGYLQEYRDGVRRLRESGRDGARVNGLRVRGRRWRGGGRRGGGGTHDLGKFFCSAQKRRQICGEEGQAVRER